MRAVGQFGTTLRSLPRRTIRIASRAHLDAIKTNVSEHANVDTGVVNEETAFSGEGACSVEKEAVCGTVVLYALTTPLSDPTPIKFFEKPAPEPTIEEA